MNEKLRRAYPKKVKAIPVEEKEMVLVEPNPKPVVIEKKPYQKNIFMEKPKQEVKDE